MNLGSKAKSHYKAVQTQMGEIVAKLCNFPQGLNEIPSAKRLEESLDIVSMI